MIKTTWANDGKLLSSAERGPFYLWSILQSSWKPQDNNLEQRHKTKTK